MVDLFLSSRSVALNTLEFQKRQEARGLRRFTQQRESNAAFKIIWETLPVEFTGDPGDNIGRDRLRVLCAETGATTADTYKLLRSVGAEHTARAFFKVKEIPTALIRELTWYSRGRIPHQCELLQERYAIAMCRTLQLRKVANLTKTFNRLGIPYGGHWLQNPGPLTNAHFVFDHMSGFQTENKDLILISQPYHWAEGSNHHEDVEILKAHGLHLWTSPNAPYFPTRASVVVFSKNELKAA